MKWGSLSNLAKSSSHGTFSFALATKNLCYPMRDPVVFELSCLFYPPLEVFKVSLFHTSIKRDLMTMLTLTEKYPSV